VVALQARQALGDIQLFTTEEVLTEFLDHLSGHGAEVRSKAAEMVRAILEAENVIVLVQSDESFAEGLSFYEKRPDTGYSHTDCVSMQAMIREGIDEVFSADRHFAQEGFYLLTKR
jgi:uncharacterized protein